MTDLEALTLTIWGEGRGEPIEGKIGIAMVMRNRMLAHYRGAANYVDVCTAHAQFSAWTQEVAQMKLATTEFESNKLDFVLELCKEVAVATILGHLEDNTNGANHYLTTDLYRKDPPDWTRGAPVLELGNQTFLNVA